MLKFRQVQPNLHELRLYHLKIYFSYETIIAFYDKQRLFITKNIFSRTTGKHLNYIDSDKNKRIPFRELLAELEKAIKRLVN